MSCSETVIDETQANVPQSPKSKPATSDSSEAMLVSPPCGTQDTAAEDVMGVDMPAIQDASNTENRVVAECTSRSSEGDEKASSHDNDDDKTKKADPPSNDRDPKDGGKDEAEVVDAANNDDHEDVSDDDTLFPPRPTPRRPGWGRNPDEDIFHIVPQTHGGPCKKRAVFRLWPRATDGKVIMPKEEPRGTLSPDGYPWGATLYDIYAVNRFANDTFSIVTIMTGSALSEAMKEMCEPDAARPEIEWAMSEAKPRDEGVANTGELIELAEVRLQACTFHEFSMREDVRRKALAMKSTGEDIPEPTEGDSDEDHDKDDKGLDEGNKDHEEDDAYQEERDQNEEDMPVEQDERDHNETDGDKDKDPSQPTMPPTSPFHSSHYPPPWPFIPFKNPMSILLQERVPLYLLPQKLFVHDPFGLLNARQGRFNDVSWMSRPDVVRTYNLELSKSVQKEVDEARRKAEELEEFKARTLIVLRYKRTREQIKNNEPVIEVPLPPYPRRLTKVNESHLYVSPTAKIGHGNHSIVYKTEWELPRDLFIRPKICRSCFKNSVDTEIQKLKDTGRWDKMLNAVGWGPTGSTGREPKQDELDEVSDPVNLERDGEIIEREIICIVPPDIPPTQIFEIVDEGDIWDALMKEEGANKAVLAFTGVEEPEEAELTKEAPVAVIRLDPPVAYERQRTCHHGPRPFSVPRTATFTVVAKLSLEGDGHLVKEASNYQNFPEHFFRHYNGYTIIKQLHTIVPVGAVVPQFYGFYTPEETESRSSYLSPILLLEHCGEQIDPEDLSVEDQEECASLFLRFQCAGWLHESIAQRNFLVQRGKPTEFPIHRHGSANSFRLIDFGRSRKYSDANEKRKEEMCALRTFTKLYNSMNLTLAMW